jgi:hypothetical protein
VASRTCLGDVEVRKFLTLPGLELRPLGRPARRQSLYRIRHPGPATKMNIKGTECEGTISI